jgi:NADH-quinone oxidoreductase subunit N
MDLNDLRLLAARNEWGAILPELLLGGLALLLLVLEIVLPKRRQGAIGSVAVAGQVAIIGVLLLTWHSGYVGREAFNGLLLPSRAGQILRLFFLLSSLLVTILAQVSLAKRVVPRVEFHHLVLVVGAAMMLLVQSHNFVMLFVALETLTIGFYILVSYFRTQEASLEAGLKYLVLGALSSALLLFGIVLLYGVAGNPLLPARTNHAFDYSALTYFLAENPHNFVASAGIVLVLAGVAFKIGAFPFQIWIPDVYQGAPTPVTAFLAVGSKAAGFGVLLVLATGVFASYGWLVTPVLSLMAGATILFGNLAALTQHNVKRLLGLSGVSHAGFLLIGVVAAASVPMAAGAVYFYLYAYLIASFAVFGVMTHLAGPDDADQSLEQYAGLARRNPFLAGVLAVGLGSLAGIPPLVGFMGKLFIFIAAAKAGLYGLLAVAITGVVLSIYYYFGWIRAAFFDGEGSGAGSAVPTRVGAVAGIALGALTVAAVVLGFYQGPLGHWLAGP